MRLTKQEQETIIVFNQADETASVYTCSKSWMQHMEKTLGLTPINELGRYAREYECPKAWIRKPRKPRQLSETHKQKLRQRLSQTPILRRKAPTAVRENGGKI